MWNYAFAQSATGVGQTEYAVGKPAKLNQVPQSSDTTEQRGLSGFFLIGIVINAVMLLSFSVWFVIEWKKQNKKKVDEKRK